MQTNAIPSLFGNTVGAPVFTAKADQIVREPQNLIDLLYEGFYMLLLLRNRHAPNDAQAFRTSIKLLLDNFETGAKKLGIETDLIFESKYAFCATIDETILRSQFDIRAAWEMQPLQLSMFGDQLAGENFYNKLEKLRNRGNAALPALEVFHQCLLLGFQGKYILEGSEKLGYLIARLGDEIAHIKGKNFGFAPRASIPDQIKNTLRNDIPVWVIATAFSVLAMLGYFGFNALLSTQTEHALNSYQNIIRLAPKNANITINLP